MAKKKNTQIEWKLTTKRFVGYIDIMGFKEMVMRSNPQTIYKMMQSLSNSLNETRQTFKELFGVEKSDTIKYKMPTIKMMTYSDSIMIYTIDNSPTSARQISMAISIITEGMFLHGIPFRGAVAAGVMTLDYKNSIFFGQPLIDAYLLSEELNFYGIVVHSTAEYSKAFKTLHEKYEYQCPFKNGKANHLTISPFDFILFPNEPFYKSLYSSISNLACRSSGAIRKYIDNTLAYMEYFHTLYGVKPLK